MDPEDLQRELFNTTSSTLNDSLPLSETQQVLNSTTVSDTPSVRTELSLINNNSGVAPVA